MSRSSVPCRRSVGCGIYFPRRSTRECPDVLSDVKRKIPSTILTLALLDPEAQLAYNRRGTKIGTGRIILFPHSTSLVPLRIGLQIYRFCVRESTARSAKD